MLYISSDGTIHKKAPWSFKRLIGLIFGFFNFIILFFKSLIGLDNSVDSSTYSKSGRSFWGGGGGGGPSGPGQGPGKGRPGGNIKTLKDFTTQGPSCPGGACGGGGCPR